MKIEWKDKELLIPWIRTIWTLISSFYLVFDVPDLLPCPALTLYHQLPDDDVDNDDDIDNDDDVGNDDDDVGDADDASSSISKTSHLQLYVSQRHLNKNCSIVTLLCVIVSHPQSPVLRYNTGSVLLMYITWGRNILSQHDDPHLVARRHTSSTSCWRTNPKPINLESSKLRSTVSSKSIKSPPELLCCGDW